MESFILRYILLLLLLFSSAFYGVRSGDAEALLNLKSSIDPLNSLPWQGTDLCKWKGVKECMRGRVTKLVLEYLNLSGILDGKILNQFDQLRVLSFKGNSISGQIPDVSGLANLKSLFLNNNNFSGYFPGSISGLRRLKVVFLAANHISGPIPDSLLKLSRLYLLYLQDNQLTGKIPPFNQSSLRFFNVSDNKLSGEIPVTPALVHFNLSSFSSNLGLCGEQIHSPCNNTIKNGSGPSRSPVSPPKSTSKHTKLIKIIAGTVGGFVLLVICSILLWIFCCVKRKKSPNQVRSKEAIVALPAERGEASGFGGKPEGFTWEGEELGNLVFLGGGDQQMAYSLEDLLKASAETLGRGTMGSTYKATMDTGFVVTVKRLKDARYPRLEEFRRHMELMGRLIHPNLVRVGAYFQAKEERLIVYDYFPNGSLFSLIHGSRTVGGSGKSLHWTSCLKIAEDLATGLLYIHQNPGLTHGNLKSSNVLLGSDFESCLTDYGLTSLRDPDSLEDSTATPLFYRAPECRDIQRPSTQRADVYSFGVLLLELLTGKTPFHDLVREHGADITRWVRSVREEETDSGDEPVSSNEISEEKLQALLSIATSCVSLMPEKRPSMREVLKMIREARAESQVSSNNSSSHSPGRWSDAIQSFPSGGHLDI